MTTISALKLRGGRENQDFISSITSKLSFPKSKDKKNSEPDNFDNVLFVKCPEQVCLLAPPEDNKGRATQDEDLVGLEMIDEAFESEIPLYELINPDDLL